MDAVHHARNGQGQAFLECKTVRWERHSAFSAGRYENSEEAQKWRRVDPIPRFKRKLMTAGIPESRLAEEAKHCQAKVSSAVTFALQSPSPGAESIYEGMFAQ
jgi:TPP-dependent pyruvate/acetoin dehydrogenase alpha subunit